MRLEWILHPAAPYAAIAIGIGLCVALFLSLKRELRVCEARWRKRLEALESAYNSKMESLDERSKEMTLISNLLVAPAPPRSGLSLSKRSQALQMFRRGEAPQDISATLSIPLNEVDLLIKVQRMAQDPLTNQTVPAARPFPAAFPTSSRQSSH
jgi:hypothetical protein